MAANDFFQDSPNFVNPAYATPEQRKQLRDYASLLQKRSGEAVQRPTGAIANWIDALSGRLEMNRAGNLEQQGLAAQNKNLEDYVRGLQGQSSPQSAPSMAPSSPSMGGPSIPAAAPPMGNAGPPPAAQPVAYAPNSPNERVATTWADADKAIQSGEFDPVGSNYTPPRPMPNVQVASLGPAGGAPAGSPGPQQALPASSAPANVPNQRVAQGFDPALIARMSTNQMATPEQRALVEGLMQRKIGEDVYGNPTETSIIGGQKALPVGPGVTPGFRSATSIAPTGVSGTSVNPAPQAGNAPSGLQLGAGGVGGAMNTMNTLSMNANRSGAVGDIAKQDIASANDAPTIKRVAGIMLDDLRTSGDKMTFGPTAEWTNNVKKIAANYAPGLMKDQLEAIASADSFDKLSAQLTGLLAKGGGTDAQLFNNMRSVPGAHNSREGAEALLKMTMQVADQQQALAQATSGATDYQSYQTAKSDFYKKNPIINPITGHPIALDLQGQKKTIEAPSGYKVLKVY